MMQENTQFIIYWSFFSTFTGPIVFWRKVMIWVNFREKMRGSSQLTIKPISRSMIRDKLRSTAKRAKPSQVSSRLKTQVKTYLHKYSLPTFNLILMCSAIVLGKRRFLTFQFSTANNLQNFSRFGEKIQDPSELCIGTPVFLLYFIICRFIYILL